MMGKTALIGVMSIITFAGTPAKVGAHDDGFTPSVAAPLTCLEPLKPIVAAFFETGIEDELRKEFKLYFKEVETYLNCLNSESARVRAEAKQASYEFERVMNHVPPSEQDQHDVITREPMETSGTLNLGGRLRLSAE